MKRSAGLPTQRSAIALVEDKPFCVPKRLNYGEDIDPVARILEDHLRKDHFVIASTYPLRWLALKLMEGDSRVMEEIGLDKSGLLSETLTHLREAHEEDIESLMAYAGVL